LSASVAVFLYPRRIEEALITAPKAAPSEKGPVCAQQ